MAKYKTSIIVEATKFDGSPEMIEYFDIEDVDGEYSHITKITLDRLDYESYTKFMN